MKKAKIFMKKITSESKKTVTQNPDAGFRRKSEKPEQQIPFHDRTIPAPTDDTNQPDKAESFRSLGLRNQTEIPNLPERSQKILPGPQKILLRLPVPELRRKLREKLFRILVPHCLQNRFSETNGLGTPPISLGNLHRPTGTKQQPPNQPAQTKQPLPVRKNATAFFSGQGLCPCRGPAARRWSCGARNPPFPHHTIHAIHAIPFLHTIHSPLFPTPFSPLHPSMNKKTYCPPRAPETEFPEEACNLYALLFAGRSGASAGASHSHWATTTSSECLIEVETLENRYPRYGISIR